ncbi:MAG: type 1 glutamine amidotransferase [Candidatus Omnitrophica bacterium]|nr:type 1 glutamine amidotransferase [Candidatus Omnitrophota bacterium]
MIIYIKNISIEGPGLIGDFFDNADHPSVTIDLYQGDRLPQSPEGTDGIIVLGGPMNVYEEGKYPYLSEECKFIRKAADRGIPFMGICLGAQLLAKTFGAAVKRSPVPEIGYYTAELTEKGREDPLFSGMGEVMRVFQWHEDTFDIPPDGEALAAGELCPNQAFRIGDHAYGLQFHFEVTSEMVKRWIKEYSEEGKEYSEKAGKLLEDEKNFRKTLENEAYRICRNFENIMRYRSENERL